MLKQRLTIGILGGALAVVVLLAENIVLSVFMALITLMALLEIYQAMGYLRKNPFLAAAGWGFSVVVFCCNVFSTSKSMAVAGVLPLILVYMLVLFIYTVLTHRKTNITDVAVSAFLTFYVSLFFMHILLVRRGDMGRFTVWLVFLGAWMTDTFAYIFGRLLGRHKLIPSVSPKKTVEGAIGGVLGTLLIFMLYGFVCAKIGHTPSFGRLAVLSVLSSLAAQFGDLGASCIKRDLDIKDFGKILPGHGGIMDRFDSVILVAPVVYYFMIWFPVF